MEKNLVKEFKKECSICFHFQYLFYVNDCCKQQICYFCKKDLENFHSCPFCRNKDWKYGNKWNLNSFTDFVLFSKDFPKYYQVIKKIVDSEYELKKRLWEYISKKIYNPQTLTFNLQLATNLMPSLEKVKFELNFKLNELSFLFNNSEHNIVFSHCNSESYFQFWWQGFPFSAIRDFCQQKGILSITETILKEAKTKDHQPLQLVHTLFDPALTTVESTNGSKLNLFQIFIIENPQFLFPLETITPEFILVNYHIAFAITDFETWSLEFKNSEDIIRTEVKDLIELEIKEKGNKDGNEIIQKLKKLKVLTEKTEKERCEISRRRKLEYILAGSITSIMARRVKLQKSTLKTECYNLTKSRLGISESLFDGLFEKTLVSLTQRNYIEKVSNGMDSEDWYEYIN